MADITVGDVAAGMRAGETALRAIRWILAALLLAFGVFAVAAEWSDDRCRSPVAKLVVRLKLDSYHSGCHCMRPSLDMSDACNSGYIPLL
jgi:hypothetical protein